LLPHCRWAAVALRLWRPAVQLPDELRVIEAAGWFTIRPASHLPESCELSGRSRAGQEHGPPTLLACLVCAPVDAQNFRQRPECCERPPPESRCCRYGCQDGCCRDTPRARCAKRCCSTRRPATRGRCVASPYRSDLDPCEGSEPSQGWLCRDLPDGILESRLEPVLTA
jgi:hypothetical protein